MKIGFFTETYLPQLNGVSISLSFEKGELTKKGNEVYVFAPKTAGSNEEDGVIRLNAMKVINSEPAQKMALPLPNRTFRKMLSVKLDLVHAHGGGFFSFLGYQLALAKGYPFVLTYHTYLAKYTHYFFIKNKLVTSKVAANGSKLMCNLADVVIVPSEKMKVVLKKYGVSKKIAVVPNPIDVKKFKNVGRGFLRTRYNLADDTIILLTVVRLGKEKNIDFIIKAFKKVVSENPKTKLFIVGDGPEKKNLETLAAKLSLQDKVIFTGFIDTEEIPQVYSDSDIFLFASTSETQGIVIPEAAACGLPFVVVRDLAFSGAVREGFNGYETPLRVEIFAKKALELSQDKEKRAEFSKNSLRLIEQNFNPDVIIQQLLDVYNEALEIRHNTPRVSSRIQNSFKGFPRLFRYVRDLNKRLFS